MPFNHDFNEIPQVSLSALRADRTLAGDRLREVFHHVGFLVLTDHGIDRQLTDEVYACARTFFAMPVDAKLCIDKRVSPHFRGWEPEGAEYTNARPDIREQIDLWTEHEPRSATAQPPYLRLLGHNQWPPDALVPGFRAKTQAWIAQASHLADELMALLALGLRLPEDCFERMFGEERMSLTKVIRYPATPPGAFGVNAHHDAGFLTVLSPGVTPGLEVENSRGEWIPVPVVEGAVVINVGEMLQSLTGNFYVATPHRVVTQHERFSLGYFHGPALDTPLTTLSLSPEFTEAVAASPRHAKAGFMAQHAETEAGVGDMQSPHHPDVYGEQLWNYFVRSYPDNVRRHYPDSL